MTPLEIYIWLPVLWQYKLTISTRTVKLRTVLNHKHPINFVRSIFLCVKNYADEERANLRLRQEL